MGTGMGMVKCQFSQKQMIIEMLLQHSRGIGAAALPQSDLNSALLGVWHMFGNPYKHTHSVAIMRRIRCLLQLGADVNVGDGQVLVDLCRYAGNGRGGNLRRRRPRVMLEMVLRKYDADIYIDNARPLREALCHDTHRQCVVAILLQHCHNNRRLCGKLSSSSSSQRQHYDELIQDVLGHDSELSFILHDDACVGNMSFREFVYLCEYERALHIDDDDDNDDTANHLTVLLQQHRHNPLVMKFLNRRN